MIVDKSNKSNIIIGGRMNDSQRFISNRGTIAAIPTISIMARRNQLWTINAFDGGIGAGSHDLVDGIVATPSQDLMPPAALRKEFVPRFYIDALLRILCKSSYADNEVYQRKLYDSISKVIYKRFNMREVYQNGETDLSSRIQRYLETGIERAKVLIEGQSNSTIIFNPRIMFNDLLGINESALALIDKSKFIEIRPTKPKFIEMFTDLEKIARGGGGTVLKGKHIVDQCCYALKIIQLLLDVKRQEEAQKEAVYLAKLEHPNIVIYKTAWLDFCTDQYCVGSSESSPISSTNDESSAESANVNMNKSGSETSTSDQGIVFEDSNSCNKSSAISKRVLLTTEPTMPRRLLRSTSCEEPRSSNSELQSAVVRYKSKGQDDELNWSGDSNYLPIDSKEWCQTVLIIQMELCRGTLKELLENRNKTILQSSDMFAFVDEEKMLEILQSILKAVQYYHGKDVIHRDLKPSNIFFDKNDIVKVGDFGLATNKFLPNECVCSESSQRHTSNIGTKPYAAPEQMAKSNYDYKVDMYSLGIIVIELFYPFKTEMEKSQIFTQFKEGNVPSNFQEKWPEQTSLILSLLSKESTKRPDAKDILSSTLFKKIASDCDNSKPLNIPKIITQHCSDEEGDCDDLDDMDVSDLKKMIQKLKLENRNLRRQNRELGMQQN